MNLFLHLTENIFFSLILCVQRSFFCRLTEDKKSEKFFRVFYDRMKVAQLEIKATVTVNTSDLGNRKRDEDSQDKDIPVRKKGQRSLMYELMSGYQQKMLMQATIYNLDNSNLLSNCVLLWCLSLFSQRLSSGHDRGCERATVRGLVCHQEGL